MHLISGPDGMIHLVESATDPTTLCGEPLCGEPLCGTGAIDPAVAVPANCDPCRIENGRRIRARMNARPVA